MADTNNLDQQLKKANDKIERSLYGFNLSEFSSNLDEINGLAQKSLKAINSMKVTGDQPDLIEFIDREFYNSKAGRGRRGTNIISQNTANKARNYESSLLSDLEAGRVDLAGEDADSVSRQARYRSIDSVCSLIPQLMRILHLYKDSIMSPNAFSELSDTDGLTFDVKKDGATDTENFQVLDTLLTLNKDYKVSSEIAPKACSDLLKYGDGYICCLDYAKEIERLLSMEDSNHTSAHEAFCDFANEAKISANESISLNNIAKSLIDEEYDVFKSCFPGTKEKKPEFKDLSAEEWEKEIDSFLNVQYHTDLLSMFPREREILEEMRDRGTVKDAKAFLLLGNESPTDEEERKAFAIDGSIVKVLDPKKVVVVEVGGKELGFYFLSAEFDDARIDSLDYDPKGCPACDLTYTSDRMYSFITHMGNSSVNKETRASILADICLKRISKKIDRKFVAKNKEFKDFIFSILRARKRLGKVNITFIPASNLIHLKRGSGTYGESVLDSVLYFAKLYVLSMLSALMQQIVSGKDKQIFYVDTGLDEDSEGAIQKFIMDFRSKEVTVDDFSDITNIMSRVTKSNSMFIPVVDGKKAVEFDNFAGQQAEFNNEFLQDLLKSIISGTGIPTSWLDSGMSDIEFATQLVQQNGNVRRTVSMYQRIMNNGVTRLFKILYKNQQTEKDVVVPDFYVHYPEPVTLDSKVAEESISRAQSIADFITNTLIGENPNERDALAKEVLKRELTKKYSSGIDWEEAEELLKTAREETQETALRNEALDKKAEETHDEEAEKHPKEAKEQEEKKQQEEGGMPPQGAEPEENETGTEKNPKEPAEPEEENEEEEESEAGGTPEEDFLNS